MKVYNLESPRSGNAVANQFVIRHDGKTFFQSYNSLIAEYDIKQEPRLTLGKDWDYSVTTVKYLGIFISENTSGYYCRGKHEIQKCIDNGEITYDPKME